MTNESLYDIPPGCICLGDGLLGMKCKATEHVQLKQKYPKWPRCKCGGVAVSNASGNITRTCIKCGAIVHKEQYTCS